MHQRLFLIHFRGAIGPKAFFIGAAYLTIVAVGRVLQGRGERGTEVDTVLTWIVFGLCGLSALLDGATAFSREFRERTSQFAMTLPIAPTRVWALILGAEVASLAACAASMLAINASGSTRAWFSWPRCSSVRPRPRSPFCFALLPGTSPPRSWSSRFARAWSF
jgi:hypothetical protein